MILSLIHEGVEEGRCPTTAAQASIPSSSQSVKQNRCFSSIAVLVFHEWPEPYQLPSLASENQLDQDLGLTWLGELPPVSCHSKALWSQI